MVPATFPAFVVDVIDFDRDSPFAPIHNAVVCHRTEDEGVILVVDHHNSLQYRVPVGDKWRGRPFMFSEVDGEGECEEDPCGDLVLFCDYEDCLPDCE